MRQTGRKCFKTTAVVSAMLMAATVIFAPTVFSHNNSAPNFDCIGCHEGEMVTDLVEIRGLPKSYVPGKKYELTVAINSKEKSLGDVAGGFAVEAKGGELIVKDKKHTQLSEGILTHTQEGSALRKWTFIWKAPAEKIGADMSVMAVAANGDYSSAGDKVGAAGYSILPPKKK